MLKYAKVINEETKQCEVGLGNNSEFYKSIGMTELDVEQSYDGWYLKGYAPKKSQELIDKEKIAEYQKYLANTDYVVVKISEAMFSRSKQLINELKNKYADVLNKRDEARKQINELEKEIKDKKEENEKQQEVIEQIQEKDIISIEESDKLPENVNDDQVNVVDDVKNIWQLNVNNF